MLSKTFLITMGFFLILSAVLVLAKRSGYAAEAITYSKERQIKEINSQIHELENMKRGYEAKALYHENQAIRIQFQKDQLQIAKRHWKLAEANRSIAKKIHKDIIELEDRKKTLLVTRLCC